MMTVSYHHYDCECFLIKMINITTNINLIGRHKVKDKSDKVKLGRRLRNFCWINQKRTNLNEMDN